MIASEPIAGAMFRAVTGCRPSLDRAILHSAQQQIRREAVRFNVLTCGRRWGKNVLLLDCMADPLLDRQPVGWFEPTYKSLADAWRECKLLYRAIIGKVSEAEHRIETTTGGSIDMWSLDNPDAGRGRKYARIVVNEAAMVKQLEQAWNESLRPTLADYQGDAYFGSTPKGRNYYWQLHCMGQDALASEWRSWQFPTSTNPYILPAEIEAARDSVSGMPERAFRQEFLAEFLEDSSGVFRGVYLAIDDGRDQPEERVVWQRYAMGVDLGRVNDFTVLVVFDSSGRQVYFERFNQISWERQIAAIEAAWTRYGCGLVWVDSTGIGDPITEMLQGKGIPAQGYHLSHQSKAALIDSYAMSIERGGIRLMDLPVQTNELIGYEYEETAAGNVRMNAPPGGHDDCVIAGALANHGLRQSGYSAEVQPVEAQHDPFARLIPGEAEEDEPKQEPEVLVIG